MPSWKAAAQQALEALYETERLAGSMAYPAAEVASAITALRAALAEPKEKPWRCACGANLYIDENGAPRSNT